MEAEDDRPTNPNDSETGNDNVGDQLRNRSNKKTKSTASSLSTRFQDVSRFHRFKASENAVLTGGDQGGDGDTMFNVWAAFRDTNVTNQTRTTP
jgi:hypothetical protein